MLRHVDRAYCLLVYNARKTQTITMTTTMVPNSPYPNIVASSESSNSESRLITLNQLPSQCMFDLAHNSNNLSGGNYAPFARAISGSRTSSSNSVR